MKWNASKLVKVYKYVMSQLPCKKTQGCYAEYGKN